MVSKLPPERQESYNTELGRLRDELCKPFVGVSYAAQIELLRKLGDAYPHEAGEMADERRAREDADRPPE